MNRRILTIREIFDYFRDRNVRDHNAELDLPLLQNSGIILSFWIGTKKSDIEVKCHGRPERNFCWHFIKQAHPDKSCKDVYHVGINDLLVLNNETNSMTLRVVDKECSMFSLFDFVVELQNVLQGKFESIVVDEDIFVSPEKAKCVTDTLTKIVCQAVVIRRLENDLTDSNSERIIEFLNSLDIKRSVNVQVELSSKALAKSTLAKIPVVTMTVPTSTHIVKSAGKNSSFTFKSCKIGFLNHLLGIFTLGNLFSIGTIRLKLEKFHYKSSDKILPNLFHEATAGQKPFEKMKIEDQIAAMSLHGIHVIINDRTSVTILVNRHEPHDNVTFIAHFEHRRAPVEQPSGSSGSSGSSGTSSTEILPKNIFWKRDNQMPTVTSVVKADSDIIISEKEAKKQKLLHEKRRIEAEEIEKSKLDLKMFEAGRLAEERMLATTLAEGKIQREDFGYLFPRAEKQKKH
ncbi:hypothetical protein L3Y34_010453 [Caenorhabditis briggsae]|uniref:Uncharacterized protein n=1 Tax=Caenorhabditis briggsae TaxID=6238 RepID=A0AAE8ZJZ5_CAEBR|nr:hypothetical protein L3Y34_010453 [Caenorhabditis briggsae]